MMTLECMVRGFELVLPRGAEKVGTDAETGVGLCWKEPAAARVREKLERRGREEKRGKVLENRMKDGRVQLELIGGGGRSCCLPVELS